MLDEEHLNTRNLAALQLETATGQRLRPASPETLRRVHGTSLDKLSVSNANPNSLLPFASSLKLSSEIILNLGTSTTILKQP